MFFSNLFESLGKRRLHIKIKLLLLGTGKAYLVLFLIDQEFGKDFSQRIGFGHIGKVAILIPGRDAQEGTRRRHTDGVKGPSRAG